MLKVILSAITISYILPSFYILKQVRKNIVRIGEPTTFYGNGTRYIKEKSVNFSFVLSTNGKKFVMRIEYQKGKEFFINYPDGFTRIINGKLVKYPSAFPYVATVLNFLLFPAEYDLSKLSIDPTTVAFTRFKEKQEIVYSIGAKDGFMEVNQMWVLKDAFLPRRFIFVNRNGFFDIVLEEFSPTKDGFMPSVILLHDMDGKGRLKIEKMEKGMKLKWKIPSITQKKEEKKDIEEEYRRFKEL